ncbi:MAG: YbaK/EbsC family protein [Oscillospiraceae bacterium]|nr:YbaK/EbsC family protein [Oscillospiraceae bacterium]
MSIEAAKAHLARYGLAEKVREFEVSSATVALAALALGVEEARIAKTLSFRRGEGCILVVAAGDARIDNRKFRDRFQCKAKMPAPEEAAELVGHAVGGVCPFGVREGVEVFLDVSLRRFDTVFPAAGSSNSAIELSPEELFRCAGAADWVDVCKLPE